MPEYSASDSDGAAGVPDAEVVAGRPDDWIAPGVAPVRNPSSSPDSLTLTFTVTVADMMASVLDHETTRKRYVAEVWKWGWRRSVPMLALTLGLVLLANLFMFDLGVPWSVLSTVGIGVMFGLVRWSQLDHVVKRVLPSIVERQSLQQLAQRGDGRRIIADSGGVTLGDAASTARFGWAQVQLSETERHILLTAGTASWAIPKRLGEPLSDFVRFARIHGAG